MRSALAQERDDSRHSAFEEEKNRLETEAAREEENEARAPKIHVSWIRTESCVTPAAGHGVHTKEKSKQRGGCGMKRRLWGAAILVTLGCGAVFGFNALEQALKAKPELPALLPEGALLSIEARDFSSLLRDWDTSEEKRAWLTSDNYSAFSNSRLFGRLSQAQSEFSAAAGLPTDTDLLNRVAGRESCLGLYDIGNLEFVYVTRLEQQRIENTPLWQIRGKFEQRTEAGTTFYVPRTRSRPEWQPLQPKTAG